MGEGALAPLFTCKTRDSAMKIECLIRRSKGTLVEFKADGKAYHFTPDEEGRHVAEVDDPAHIKRLLSIEPETYIKCGTKPKSLRYQKRQKQVEFETEKVDLEDLMNNGETSSDKDDENLGDDQGDNKINDNSDSKDDGGELDSEDMKAFIDDEDDGDEDNDSVIGSLDEGDDTKVVDYEALNEEELALVYEQKFGKKPHHNMKPETILEKLNESKG